MSLSLYDICTSFGHADCQTLFFRKNAQKYIVYLAIMDYDVIDKNYKDLKCQSSLKMHLKASSPSSVVAEQVSALVLLNSIFCMEPEFTSSVVKLRMLTMGLLS